MTEGSPPDGNPPGLPVGQVPVAAAHDAVAYRDLLTSFGVLYSSARKCWRGVGWKYSAQAYRLNIIERTVGLMNDLRNGTYREGPVRNVHITYPKKRLARSITFRDRSYQRGLNDLALYPRMTKSFIWANFACQKGKGTEAALLYMKRMLHNAWLRWRSDRFQILSGDIKGYYDSMLHDVAEDMFRRRTDEWTFGQVKRTLRHQYKGDRGYNPGSQMVQIAGISYLDPFDHFMKETLRRKFYLRYMDDWHVLGAPGEDMDALRSRAAAKLGDVGLTLHPTKTKVRLARDGVVFLGFLFRVTETGKVLMFRDPKRVKEVKRRLRRLARVVRRGTAGWRDFDNSLECVLACMGKGNSNRLMRGMRDFADQQKKGGDNA